MLERLKRMVKNSSYDKSMFSMTLFYTLSLVEPNEEEELEFWIVENFWSTHKKEIREVFNKVNVGQPS